MTEGLNTRIGWRSYLGSLPTPLAVLSAGDKSTIPFFCSQYPVFAPGSLEVAVGVFFFLAFLYPVVHNLPQLRMLAVIFSPLEYLSVLLLEETFVQM